MVVLSKNTKDYKPVYRTTYFLIIILYDIDTTLSYFAEFSEIYHFQLGLTPNCYCVISNTLCVYFFWTYSFSRASNIYQGKFVKDIWEILAWRPSLQTLKKWRTKNVYLKEITFLIRKSVTSIFMQK